MFQKSIFTVASSPFPQLYSRFSSFLSISGLPFQCSFLQIYVSPLSYHKSSSCYIYSFVSCIFHYILETPPHQFKEFFLILSINFMLLNCMDVLRPFQLFHSYWICFQSFAITKDGTSVLKGR